MACHVLLQVKLLGGAGASALTLWAQDTYAASLAGAAPPLLAGLRVSEQPAYPLPQVRAWVGWLVCWWVQRRQAPSLARPASRLPAHFSACPSSILCSCVPPTTRSIPASLPCPSALQALCGQLLREMDPETGIEDAYKRVAEDPVYRWRVGRTVAAAGA